VLLSHGSNKALRFPIHVEQHKETVTI